MTSYWHLCDELTVHQAALLFFDIDPALKFDKQPNGYFAMCQAISSALRRKDIVGTTGSNPDESTVEVESLRQWLQKKNATSSNFYFKCLPPGLSDPSPTVINWISVSDRLPPKNIFVFTLFDWGLASLRICKLLHEAPLNEPENIVWVDLENCEEFRITHWAPMQDPQAGIKFSEHEPWPQINTKKTVD